MHNYELKRKQLGIEEQIAEFFNKGNKITQCPPCEYSIDYSAKFNNKRKDKLKINDSSLSLKGF